MRCLTFKSDTGAFCQISLSDPKLPDAIQAQIGDFEGAWSEVEGLEFTESESDVESLEATPLFFEWQQLHWLYEPGEQDSWTGPLQFSVNGSIDSNVSPRSVNGRLRLVGTCNLGNAVGKTRFHIKDAAGKQIFGLGAEVFPQKLDYKDDFPAMVDEITEVVYSLAFDVFQKTYASTKTRTTYRQSLSEWLNLYRLLAATFERSIDVILRSPKYKLDTEQRIKSVDRVKKTNHAAIVRAIRNPARFCRGGGINIATNLAVSHLEEQHRKVSYDTPENRFVAWAIRDVIKKIEYIISELDQKPGVDKQSVAAETRVLRDHQRKLRFRLNDSSLQEVKSFNHRAFFSTTMTMAPGYKEFYHRYLLLRKGLTLADNDIFSMDYKDIATLYEYWCFLKTIKLLRDDPKYDLESSDIVKIEHQKFTINLKKGTPSRVHFRQKTTGDQISLYYNREFPAKKYTHTFKQIPDNFIEFSRAGYTGSSDTKRFKVVMDAKYRFDRGTIDYPNAKVPFGPPLDTIAQLHRYRDAILWEQDTDDSVKTANKSLGGVILFPYPDDELQFSTHPFYQSIERVNIGAIPLQPGKNRKNTLYKKYLDALFESSGDTISERRVHYDAREYNSARGRQRELVLVGLIPSNYRQQRMQYHFDEKAFYIQWPKASKFPLEKVSTIALYDQQSKCIIGWAEIGTIDWMQGSQLSETGTSWPARKPEALHCLYRLKDVVRCSVPAGRQMQGQRAGRFVASRLGLDLAVRHQNADLLFLNSWEKYREWKDLCAKHEEVRITRKPRFDQAGYDVSELEFEPVLN